MPNEKQMELKDIASVSGKPGLYKIVKPTRTGLILESMDGKNTRIVTGPNNRVSLLHEISIYTEEYDKTIPLGDVLKKIKNEFNDDPGVDAKSESDELKAFMEHIVPDYDRDKVYVSDMKKIVTWFVIINRYAPEVLQENPTAEVTDNKEEAMAEPAKEAAEKTETPAKAKPKKKPVKK